MGASMVSGIQSAVTEVTGGFSAVAGWWVVGVAVAFFGAGIYWCYPDGDRLLYQR